MQHFSHKDFPPLPARTQQRSGPPERNGPVGHHNTAKTPSLNLMDFPDELLLKILDHLPSTPCEKQLSDAKNLALTNRRFNCLASERVYDSFWSQVRSPYLFLRTLMSSPYLAGQVQHLFLDYGAITGCPKMRYLPKVSDKRAIKDGFKALGIPEWKFWATICNAAGAEREHLIAAIMMHTPNIRSLDIQEGPESPKNPKWLDLIRRAVSSAPFGRTHRFLHLQSIEISVRRTTLNQLAPLFKLPSLKRVDLEHLFDLGQSASNTDSLCRIIPARCSAVQRLDIRPGWVESKLLAVLLDSLQALARFSYFEDECVLEQRTSHSTYDEDDIFEQIEEYDTPVNYPLLYPSLYRHRHSLTHLDLGSSNSILPTEPVEPFASFRDFERLVFLRAPWDALIRTNSPAHPDKHLALRLPPSLKRLHVSNLDEEDEQNCIAAMAGTEALVRDLLPSLKSITVVLCSPLRWREQWDAVMKGFRPHGVRFKLWGEWVYDSYDMMDDMGDAFPW